MSMKPSPGDELDLEKGRDGFGDSNQYVEIYKSRVNGSQPDLQNLPLF